MTLKIKATKLAMWIFILSTLFSGIFWEVVGWIALFYCFYKYKNNLSFVINIKKVPLILFLGIICGYVVFQCMMLGLNVTEIIRLYGITKTVFTIPIIILLLEKYIYTNDLIIEILPLILIIDWITMVSLITKIDVLNLTGGSINYLGAINVILFPYVFKFILYEHKLLKTLFLITFVSLVVFSGSRTLMLTATVIFCSTVFMEKNMNKKIKYLLLLVVIVLMGIFVLGTISENTLIARGLSVFSNITDGARSGLKMFAERQYNGYSSLEKLIGNGDIMVKSQLKPVHNIFWEILLCYGKIGLVAWIIYLICWLLFLIRAKMKNRMYMLMLFGIVLMIGWVQPFISSGYLFQFIVALTFIQLYFSDSPEEIKQLHIS